MRSGSQCASLLWSSRYASSGALLAAPFLVDQPSAAAVEDLRAVVARCRVVGAVAGHVTHWMAVAGDKELVEACLAGEAEARQRFQEQFLPLIYRFDKKGGDYEGAGRDFLSFLFEEDRLYRRLRGYRGQAPLGVYLWAAVLPDLLKQFRGMIRRERLLTVPFDDNPGYEYAAAPASDSLAGAATPAAAALAAQLAPEKRLLLKLLYIEDFDLDAAEVQLLAQRSGRTIREVVQRVEAAREAVRSREAMQHERLQGAESAGQWVRLYSQRLAQLDEDMAALDSNIPLAAKLRARREDVARKLDWRRRQLAERLCASRDTVVTTPTDLLADLLNQHPTTTRGQIARLRRELAERWGDQRAALVGGSHAT